MEPHSQPCGTACYAHTGDILNKEHLPTAKTVVLCVMGEQYAAVMKDEMNFLRSRHIWIQLTFWLYTLTLIVPFYGEGCAKAYIVVEK